MLGSIEITVESLSAHRAVEKLARAGVAVLAARCPEKNTVVLRIAGRDSRKTFAILRGSCYNIKNVRKIGLSRLADAAKRCVGLIAGAALMLALVAFAQSRVLKVEIVGNGAYYEREVREILTAEGVRFFSAAPKETGLLTAKILSLPRVEFCSFAMKGGVLTVEVRCAQESAPLASGPLSAPVSGVVEELVVVRGTPLAAPGDEVSAGDAVVGDYLTVVERQTRVAVIAKVTVRYPVSREYALSEQAARAQAYLDFGSAAELHMTKTERGWLAEGTAFSTAALGLD